MAKAAKPNQKTIHLIPSDHLDEWPTQGGRGIVEGNFPENADSFRYNQRKGNRLIGVKGISKHHVKWAPIQAGHFGEPGHPISGNPNLLTDNSIFGLYSIRFNCNTEKAQPLVMGFTQNRETLSCRFMIKVEEPFVFGSGFKELPISALHFRGQASPKVCIVQNGSKFFFGFAERLPGSWTGNKIQSFSPKKIEVVPGSLYCVEYRVMLGKGNRGSMELGINGVPHSRLSGSVRKKEIESNHVVVGKLSPSSLKGAFLVDELVLSHTPIGSMPQKPVMMRCARDLCGSAFLDSEASPQHLASQWQISHTNSWVFPLFNSGEDKVGRGRLPIPYVITLEGSVRDPFAFDKPVQIPTGLQPGKNYLGRVRHKNQHGNWSEWCEPLSFVAPPKQSSSPLVSKNLPYVKDAFFTEADRKRRVSWLGRNEWYDLHVHYRGKGPNPFSRTPSYLDVYLCGDPDGFEGNYQNQGGAFRARDNYVISFSLDRDQVAVKEVEGKGMHHSVTGKEVLFCDASPEGFERDPIKNRIRIRVRLLDPAVGGLWKLIACAQSYRTGMSPMLHKPFYVKSRNTRIPRETGHMGIGVAIFIGAVSFLALGFVIGRKRKPRSTLTAESKSVADILPSGSSSGRSHRVQAALDFINGNYTRPISTKDVAQAVNLSSNRLGISFREHTGKTVVQFINELRIAEAKRLLKSTTLNITEISFQSGYKTLDNFERAFLQNTGTSPSQYRKTS